MREHEKDAEWWFTELEWDISAKVLAQKELMRHSTIAMTMDGYGRGVPEANREANSRLVKELLQ